jgi:hypothetical protein
LEIRDNFKAYGHSPSKIKSAGRKDISPAAVAFFENGPEPGSGGGTDTCCERRTIASGRSHATVGKRQRKRQKSRQVTDLPCDRHLATAAVSPAVSLFAVQHVSVPPPNRR